MSAVKVPFEIPASWRWVRLIEIAEVLGGSTPPKESISSRGVPYFKVAEMNLPGNEKYLRHTSLFVSPSCKIRRFPASTLVFPKNGGALLTNKKRILMNESICDLNTGGIALHSTEILKYAYYWFYSVDLHDFLTGGVIPTINAVAFRNQQFPLPPLAEQKRIVAKVEELLAIADSLGSAADDLENAAKRLDKKILDLAIRGRLVPQDPNDEPASELEKRIAASHKSPSKNQSEPIDPPFDIPDSWEWVRLGLLVQVISGVSYSKSAITESGIRILRGGNLNENAELTFYDDDVFISSNYYDNDNEIRRGDIVIVASTGSSKVIGRPAIATHDMSGVQIGAFLRIVRTQDLELSKWIATLFCSRYYRTYIRKISKGTNIKNLKAEYITGFAIPLPPLAEQKRIVAKIEELRVIIKSLTT